MSNDRRISAAILTRAAELTGKVRGPQHGSIEESFDMIGEMWSVYVNNAIKAATGIEPNPRVNLSGVDVLRMMGQLKQARALWGDASNVDNYVDEAGYAGLAATYVGAELPESTGRAVEGNHHGKVVRADPHGEPIPPFLTKNAPDENADPHVAVEKALRGGKQ